MPNLAPVLVPGLDPGQNPGTIGLLVLRGVAGQLVHQLLPIGRLGLVQDGLENFALQVLL